MPRAHAAGAGSGSFARSQIANLPSGQCRGSFYMQSIALVIWVVVLDVMSIGRAGNKVAACLINCTTSLSKPLLAYFSDRQKDRGQTFKEGYYVVLPLQNVTRDELRQARAQSLPPPSRKIDDRVLAFNTARWLSSSHCSLFEEMTSYLPNELQRGIISKHARKPNITHKSSRRTAHNVVIYIHLSLTSRARSSGLDAPLPYPSRLLSVRDLSRPGFCWAES